MNHYMLALSYPCFVTGRGTGVRSRFWWDSQGRCQRCTRLITPLDGIFCANFGRQPFGSKICQNAWCPDCYRTPDTINFLVWRARDPVTGNEIIDEGDERRHKEARLGDSLICPFECDDCAFFRLFHWWPNWQTPDQKYIGAFIRQANLDMFWAREPSTVGQSFREFREQAIGGQELGYVVFEPMGPFGRCYDPGMRAAIGVLMKGQKPGRHEDKIKFSAARRARTVHTNMFKASARGCECSLCLRTDQKWTVASLNPTDSEFYTLFTRGLQNRVGE